MAKNSIVEKLDAFLRGRRVPKEECHITHILVELRKILDHEKKMVGMEKYPILRFYCDWSVHIAKDRIPPCIKTVATRLYSDIQKQLSDPAMVIGGNASSKFAYMEDLRSELRELLQKLNLNTSFIDRRWESFVALLVKILEEQPINNPIPEIQSIAFEPSASGCCIFVVKFTESINGYSSFRYGNAF